MPGASPCARAHIFCVYVLWCVCVHAWTGRLLARVLTLLRQNATPPPEPTEGGEGGLDGATTHITAQSSRLQQPFMIVPDVPEPGEGGEGDEKERVDAVAASAEVAALLNSPAATRVLVDTGVRWDGIEKISSLEACNGVTKARGVLFAPPRLSQLHSFSFMIRLKRGVVLAFTPIVALWDQTVHRATDILYTGPVQKCQSASFQELTCAIPADLEILGGRERPLVLAFWSELVTDVRSAGADMGQVLGIVAEPVIRKSVYLNGKMASGTLRCTMMNYHCSPRHAGIYNVCLPPCLCPGTWREYESTLVGKFCFTPSEPLQSSA